MSETKKVLQSVKEGKISVEEAELMLKTQPLIDLGYAKVDTHRALRQGAAEVIFGEKKTAEQITGIVSAMQSSGQNGVLITRLSEAKFKKLAVNGVIEYFSEAQAAIVGEKRAADGLGRIVIATGGTSDMSVAEEAAVTAEFLGNEVERVYDVGVSGLHRLLSYKETLMSASVVIAVAGMEGALASVIGGLVSCPVIAVPTSVGYGASYGGLAALLSMLNSCASGVSVVNIDNGFGAGFIASRINHMGK
ncbi:MAG: nickel pincer cofactor biosynthesis protein LarB [Clostridia bacterium]|nr:nickel pincer cofactor biosynthesis protein LarB [Clostridia bacterium]